MEWACTCHGANDYPVGVIPKSVVLARLEAVRAERDACADEANRLAAIGHERAQATGDECLRLQEKLRGAEQQRDTLIEALRGLLAAVEFSLEAEIRERRQLEDEAKTARAALKDIGAVEGSEDG